MAGSTSLVGSSVPQLPPSFDLSSNRRTLSNWIHSSSTSTRLRRHRLSLTSSSLHFSNRRKSYKAFNGGLGFQSTKGDVLKQYTAILGEPVRESVFSPQLCCTSCCLASSRKHHASLGRFVPRFFLDKSTFQLSKNQQKHAFGKKVQLPHATVGPDEPHATSTTWPHGDTEKQELSVLDPKLEQIEAFLGSKLPSHPKLYRGQLKNGLRYLILPNKVPPNRFEAHLEVHAGSIDEEDDEQGIAHMIEHVAFLGSKKREKLLGTGARSNAYTDFHHTVFHIHAPASTKVQAI